MSNIDIDIEFIANLVADETIRINLQDLGTTWYLSRVCCAIEDAENDCMYMGFTPNGKQWGYGTKKLGSVAEAVMYDLQDLHEALTSGAMPAWMYMDTLSGLRKAIRDAVWAAVAM